MLTITIVREDDETTDDFYDYYDYTESVEQFDDISHICIEQLPYDTEEFAHDDAIIEEFFLAVEKDQLEEFYLYYNDQNCNVEFSRFEEAFEGYYYSFGEFVKEREQEIFPDAFKVYGRYIDWEAFADGEYSHDYTFNEEMDFVYRCL